MKTISIVIEASKDCIGAYSEGDEGIFGVGDTIEECKQSVQDAIYSIKEFISKDQVPEVLKGEYEIVYKYDTKSLLQYYKGILTNSALERLTGINQRQMYHYATGIRRPTKKTTEKIETALHDLGRELLNVKLA